MVMWIQMIWSRVKLVGREMSWLLTGDVINAVTHNDVSLG